MAEAEVDPKWLNQNHTYFVPVDRSSPAHSDVANDVVMFYRISPFCLHFVLRLIKLNDSQNTQNEGQTTDVKQDETVRLRRQTTTIMRTDVEPRDMTEVRTVVRGHMMRGIHLTSNFRDEQVIN